MYDNKEKQAIKNFLDYLINDFYPDFVLKSMSIDEMPYLIERWETIIDGAVTNIPLRFRKFFSREEAILYGIEKIEEKMGIKHSG